MAYYKDIELVVKCIVIDYHGVQPLSIIFLFNLSAAGCPLFNFFAANYFFCKTMFC